MSNLEGPTAPVGNPDGPGPEVPLVQSGARRWTISRVMIGIASLAPLLALARSPFAFGLVVTIGLYALFVGDGVRRRRYGRIAGLICAYPLVPLALIYLDYGLITRKMIRKSSTTVLDGVIAFSDIGGYLCLMAYVGCVAIAYGSATKADPGLRHAARQVVFLMPAAWAALFVLAIWDPFGVLGYFIH